MTEEGYTSSSAADGSDAGTRATLVLVNAQGLHARPAARFVEAAERFECDISVRNVTRDSPAANAKSMLAVLALGAEHGHSIEVAAGGPDAQEALAVLVQLVESGLGEGGG